MLDESYCSDEDGEDWESWMPDPVDADPGEFRNWQANVPGPDLYL